MDHEPGPVDRRDDLARLWSWFAESTFRGYSPLYERIAGAVAADARVLGLQREAPPDAHLPPLLLAAVHYLLLDGLDHPLADVYAGTSESDPAPLFVELCLDHHDALLALLRTRRIQTNDCGRSALLVPGLTWATSRLSRPAALVDVGASAGLNLIANRYRFEYGDHGATGPAESPVVIECDVVGGSPPIPPALPAFAERVGLDRSPIDLGNPDDARWLLACVWPDTGRLARTDASIRLAQELLPPVETGDAVTDLPHLLDGLDEGLAVVVVNTWSFSYLDPAGRRRYVEVLAEASTRRPVVWLLADDRSAVVDVPELDVVHPPGEDGAGHVLGAVAFDRGRAEGRVLASVHQHGSWLDWQDA